MTDPRIGTRPTETIFTPEQSQHLRVIASRADNLASLQPQSAVDIWQRASVAAVNYLLQVAPRPVNFMGLADMLVCAPTEVYTPEVTTLEVATGSFDRSVFFEAAVRVLLTGEFFVEAANVQVGALAVYYHTQKDYENESMALGNAIENFKRGGRLDLAAENALILGQNLVSYGLPDLGIRYIDRAAVYIMDASNKAAPAERSALLIGGIQKMVALNRLDLATKLLNALGDVDQEDIAKLAAFSKLTMAVGEEDGRTFYRHIEFTLKLSEKLSGAGDHAGAARALHAANDRLTGSGEATLIARQLLMNKLAELPTSTASKVTASAAAWLYGQSFSHLIGTDPKSVTLTMLMQTAYPEGAKEEQVSDLQLTILQSELADPAEVLAEKRMTMFGPELERLGQNEAAIKNYEAAEKYYASVNDGAAVAKALCKQATVQQRIGQSAKSEELFRQSYNFFEAATNPSERAAGFDTFVDANKPLLAFMLLARASRLSGFSVDPLKMVTALESTVKSGKMSSHPGLLASYVKNAFAILGSVESTPQMVDYLHRIVQQMPAAKREDRVEKIAMLQKVLEASRILSESARLSGDLAQRRMMSAAYETIGGEIDLLVSIDGGTSLYKLRPAPSGASSVGAPLGEALLVGGLFEDPSSKKERPVEEKGRPPVGSYRSAVSLGEKPVWEMGAGDASLTGEVGLTTPTVATDLETAKGVYATGKGPGKGMEAKEGLVLDPKKK